MPIKQVSLRLNDTVYNKLNEVARLANIDVAKAARYLVYRELAVFDALGTEAYEVNFWTSGAAWIKHKDAMQEMKAFEYSEKGREEALKHGIEVDKIVDEIDKDEEEKLIKKP